MKSRPFVSINVAMTADGKLAPAGRRFVPFTTKRDQELMLVLRAENDAVMSGARTVDLGEVALGSGGEKYRRRARKLPLQKNPRKNAIEITASRPHMIPSQSTPRARQTERRAPIAGREVGLPSLRLRPETARLQLRRGLHR